MKWFRTSEMGTLACPVRLGRRLLTKVTVLVLALSLIALAPLFLTLGLPLYLFRWALPSFAKAFRPDLLKLATAPSSLFMADDPHGEPRANLLGYMVFQGALDPDQLRADVLANLLELRRADGSLVYPELRQAIGYWFGVPFWRRVPNFQLGHHLRVMGLAEVELEELYADRLEAPFPEDRSPWDITLYQNYGLGGGKSLVLVRLHHALADGYSTLKLLARLFPGMKFRGPGSRGRRSWVMRLLFGVAVVMKAPFDWADQFTEGFDWWDSNPWHRRDLAGKYWVGISEPVPVTLVKEIKERYRTSFNAVIHAALAGGIRNVLIKYGEAVPRKIHLSAPFPRQGHPDKLRNHFTVAFIKLPTGTADPLERLRLTGLDLRKLQASTMPIVYEAFTALVGGLVRPLTRVLGRNYYTTGMISNIPGTEVFSYRGAPCLDNGFGGGTMPGLTGITIGISSYNGSLRMVTTVDQAILPTRERVQDLNRHIIQEFSVLRKYEHEVV